tara:strand:+ start:347 stop:484 length:138 start_codon:yes stop_codon:yes gene_type:complete
MTPFIQTPINGCIDINRAIKSPAKNMFFKNNKPNISVTVARLNAP